MAHFSSIASQVKCVIFLCLLLKGVASNTRQMSDIIPQKKYDVFVSFRGKDIRHGFLSHLTEAFHQKQIYAFIDYELEKGDEIWPSLAGAIQGSSISLTIFSENYAYSSWCLEELVTILECREKYNQSVIPVFYNVYPTEVRHQLGSYENGLVEHGKKYNFTTVQKWSHALKKAADLSGIKSFDYKTEVELIGEIINIVNLVLMKLGKHPLDIKGVVGIEKPIQYLESLLHQESKNVRVIGIWGMGGIGKTTIAEEIFNKHHSEYNGYFFLPNVKEESKRQGTIYLKEKLFSTLLGEVVQMNAANGLSNYIKRKIGRMKVLIVLDDVNDSDLLENLFENHDWFGQGSRIIITTRDKQVLVSNNVDDIYQVGALNSSEAMELFSLYAFNRNHFDMEYYELSKRVVNYAKGIPLVLKVLGHLLCGKDKEVWKSQLDKLKNMPNTDVYNSMRLSYDDLDRKEQKVLLDLACFFIGLNLKLDQIKLLLRDNENDNSVVVGLERLKDKALITISKDDVVSMHTIIKEMAWEIVRQESIEDPGSRSRLSDLDDINEVLTNNKGTEAVRSIRSDKFVMRKLQLSPHVFSKMRKLQYLHFSSIDDPVFFVLPPHGLQSFPVELRYLVWMYYPLNSLPENFSAENLVILDLSYSQVEKLWDGVQNLKNLNEVKVTHSLSLKELPDLSKAVNLEVLDIGFCPQLTSLTPSIFSLNKLERLDLRYCSLTKITSENHLSSLSYLSLKSCKKLREFSVTSENMITLDLSTTRVNALPSTFGRQSKLKILWLRNSGIESFPSSFKNLTSLKYLGIDWCTELHTLTELPPSLETLDARDCTSLKTVLFPSILEQLKENRRDVRFWNCLKLDEQSLKAIGLNVYINVMKFAYHHLSVPDENYNQSYGSDQVKYVYPGSRVPEWLEYKTTKDYLIIDLSSTPQPTQLGIIFSFVISGPKGKTVIGYRFKFCITFSDDEDESKKESIDVYMSDRIVWVASDHVCVIYDHRCSRYLNRRPQSQRRLKIEVTAMSDCESRELKGFGVRLINFSAYHSVVEHKNPTPNSNFIGHLTTSADHCFVQRKYTSSDHSFIQQTEVYDRMYFILTLLTILCISLLCLSCMLSPLALLLNRIKYLKWICIIGYIGFLWLILKLPWLVTESI